ncbi:MAG: PilT/PilU family type 4a pilus ATPase [Acidimicrobiales bacterium]
MAPPSSGGMDASSVSGWIKAVRWKGGTDLLITEGSPPMARIGGAYVPLPDTSVLDSDDTRDVADALLAPSLRLVLRMDKQVDFSFSWREELRVRGNAFVQRGSVAIALRIIPRAVPTVDDLRIPDSVRRMASRTSGLVLVTGPTGSGKSTTLAALIDHVNTTRACHILTFEDPIEYIHRHKRSVVHQREVGIDAMTFGDALRASLREDPDVLLVGEMRDLESISIALTLAEVGHLVFAPLHTNDTAQAIDRIVDVFPADRRDQIQVQLSATLQGVVYQRLLPRTGGGLIAAFEVMVATHAVRNLVREGKTRQLRNVVATHAEEGMQTLESSLSDLLTEGLITEAGAVAVSLHPNEITMPVPEALSAASKLRRRLEG